MAVVLDICGHNISDWTHRNYSELKGLVHGSRMPLRGSVMRSDGRFGAVAIVVRVCVIMDDLTLAFVLFCLLCIGTVCMMILWR